MKRLILCLVLLAAPATAQTKIGADGNVTLDVGAVAEEVLRIDSAEGSDASFRYLDGIMREARGKGWLSADSGVLFAMYTDSIRNIRANPTFALRVAEEGLALVRSGTPKDPRDPYLLEVSRAYALADLGRFDEAIEAATLALPTMREAFPASVADELEGYIAEWRAGRMSESNESALDLARKAIARAEKATDASEQVTVLAEASRAILPPGAGFDPGEVALVNAEARALAGRALYLMNRKPEAEAMLSEGIAGLYGADWATTADPQPMVPVPEGSRARIVELFVWLHRAAIDRGDRPLAVAALRQAERYAPGTTWPGTILLGWMQLAVIDGNVAEVDRATAQAAAEARAEGFEDFARLAEFYRATAHASIVPTWDEVDVIELVRTAKRAMEYATPGSSVDGGHVQSELASFLIQTGNLGAGLMAVREATVDESLRRADASGPAAEAHAAKMRKLAELHLFALNQFDSQRPEAVCFGDDTGRGCVVPYQAGR